MKARSDRFRAFSEPVAIAREILSAKNCAR
jgi:hypothetical protein